MSYNLFKLTLPENLCVPYEEPTAIPSIIEVDVSVDPEDAGSQMVDIEITKYTGTGLTGYSTIICTSAVPAGVTLPVSLAATGANDADLSLIWIYPETFPTSVTIISVQVAYVIDGVVGTYSDVWTITPATP